MKILFLILATSALSLSAAKRPNILFIFTDDHAYQAVGAYDSWLKEHCPTPNIDSLARDGMLFEQCYVTNSICGPMRAAIQTGKYSHANGFLVNGNKFDGTQQTFPKLLRKAGYTTAVVGKWHLGMEFPGDRGTRDWTQPVTDMPLDKGFDYFFGIPASLNYGILAWFEGRHAKVPPLFYTQKKGNRIAIDDYRIKPPYESVARSLGETNKNGIVQGQLEIASDFVDSECLTRFTNEAIEWMEQHCRGSQNEKPFFLYLPYTSPHKPVIPIEKFRGKSDAGAYGDFMMETDWHIGRIMKAVERLGVSDETMIVFSSDNGPETTWKKRAEVFQHKSNLIYREGKRSIYEGGHRVPFFVRWPAKVKPNTSTSHPICQTDLLATFAEILKVKLPANAGEDSFSFLSELLSLDREEQRAPIVHHSSGGGFAIRDRQWKLVMKHRRQEMELYNLSSDPSEKNDLIKDHPDKVVALTDKLSSIIQNGRSNEGPAQTNDQVWWDDLTWLAPVR